MKRFVFVFICFWILYFAMIASIRVLWVQTAPLRLERNFINEDIHTVVLGPSNGECAWNDSIIPHSLNLCASGTSIGACYSTLKWVVEYNEYQVDTIAICASFVSIAYYNDDRIGPGLWEERNSVLNYCKYLSFFGKRLDFWGSPFMSFPIWLFNESRVGGSFQYLIRDKMNHPNLYNGINSIIKEAGGKCSFSELYFRNHNSYQVENLQKIKKYCEEHNKVLIILNTPVYKIPDMIDDSGYRQLIRVELGDSVWIADYSRFEFPDSTYYADLEHLNYRGAEYFSNHIAQNGLELKYAIDYCK